MEIYLISSAMPFFLSALFLHRPLHAKKNERAVCYVDFSCGKLTPYQIIFVSLHYISLAETRYGSDGWAQT